MSAHVSPILWGHRLGPGSDDPQASDLQQTVTKVAAVLSRRRWLFVIPLLAGLLISLAVSLLLPRRYGVGAIFERRDDAVITRLVSAKSPYSFETLRYSLSLDLRGYGAVATAVEQLRLTRDYARDSHGNLTEQGEARRQALIAGLVRDISVNLREKSEFLDLIEVRYVGSEPVLGKQVVNRLKDNYMAAIQIKVQEILLSAHAFFAKEADACRQKVTAMEMGLLRTAIEHPGVDPSDPDLLDQRLMSQQVVLEQLDRAQAEQLSQIEAREAYLRELSGQQEAGTPSAGHAMPPLADSVANPKCQQLADQIQSVRAQIADAKIVQRMTDAHPSVVGLRRKLESLEAALREEPQRVPKTVTVTPNMGRDVDGMPWETERRRAEMELKSLRETLGQTQQRIAKHQSEQAYLEKEKASLFTRRETFLLRQQELQVAKKDLDVWASHVDTLGRILTAQAENRGLQFTTVEDARCPRKPSSPTLGGVMLFSAGIGLALGVAVVFLREVFDRSFRDPARVNRVLGIPILETIGEIRIGASRGWLSRRRLLGAAVSAQAVLVVGLALLVYLSLEDPALYDRVTGRAASLWAG